MKKTSESKEKYVTEKTFEKHMQSMAKSFARSEEVSSMILKEIMQIRQENKNFRMSISDLNIDGASYSKHIKDLDLRVEKLEFRK